MYGEVMTKKNKVHFANIQNLQRNLLLFTKTAVENE